MGQIKMKSDGTRKCKESVRDIGQIASTLGDIQKYLTVVHAFRGCFIFGQEKLSILRLLSSKNKKKTFSAREVGDNFCDSNATPEQATNKENNIFSLSFCLLSSTRIELSTRRQFKCKQFLLETSGWNIDTSPER